IRDLKDRSTMLYAGGDWSSGDLKLNFDVNHFVAAYGFYNNGVFGSAALPRLRYDISGTIPASVTTGSILYGPGSSKVVPVINRLYPSPTEPSAGKTAASYTLNQSLLTHLLAGVPYGQTEQNNITPGLFLGAYNIPAAQKSLSNFPGLWAPTPIQDFFKGYR